MPARSRPGNSRWCPDCSRHRRGPALAPAPRNNSASASASSPSSFSNTARLHLHTAGLRLQRQYDLQVGIQRGGIIPCCCSAMRALPRLSQCLPVLRILACRQLLPSKHAIAGCSWPAACHQADWPAFKVLLSARCMMQPAPNNVSMHGFIQYRHPQLKRFIQLAACFGAGHHVMGFFRYATADFAACRFDQDALA